MAPAGARRTRQRAAIGRKADRQTCQVPRAPASPGLSETAPGSVPARSRWAQLVDPHGPRAGVRSVGAREVRYGLGRRVRFGRPRKNSLGFFEFL